MIKININDHEKELLQQYRKSNLALIRHKSEAILLANDEVLIDVISRFVNRKDRTVQCWLSDWSKRRMSSIFTGHEGNINSGKLTKHQLDEIRQTLQSPPSDFGLPKAFWDVPQLKDYLNAQFDVMYETDKSYHFLLKFSNLSFKYPDKFDIRRNDEFIVKRMKEIEEEITPLIKSSKWGVFSVDEVRVDQEDIVRKAWLQKGKRTIIKVNRKKESQSYIGFLDQKNGVCEMFDMSWQKSEEVLRAFERFLKIHPNKKIAIVWDNASFHKSIMIRKALEKGELLEKVHLIPMPPYAPDHNPIEHVWNTAKQTISNIQFDNFIATKKAFEAFVKSRKFEYRYIQI